MDHAFHIHWPLPSGFDFAKGRCDIVAAAVGTEFQRFIGGEPLSKEERRIDSIADVFAAPQVLDNVGLHYFVLPTKSDWTAIWTSTFLCCGHDSLSFCLTKNHRFETVHFTSFDRVGPFQPGTVLSHRSPTGERHVAAIQEDSRWIFHQSGTPLPEEDISRYQKRKISDRWNLEALLTVLSRKGIRPWSEDFYDLSEPIYHFERRSAPSTVIRMNRKEFSQRYETKTG
jgi:hypothetical protein